ncbi:MAG TPA: oligosaccharide flippase family protein [Bacteroidales bacterium]|nr:oligosaccharide flippase family protein [Bacteroidales bacterium]
MTVHPIKRLASQTAIYGLSSIIGRLLNYLLVPLYTHLIFDTHEYGTIILMYSYVAFLLVLLTYGMETAFFRFYQNEEKNRSTVLGTSFWSLICTSLFFIVLVLLFRKDLSQAMGFMNSPHFVGIMAVIVGLDAIASIPFARLRAENRPLKFAGIKFINIGVNIGLNLFFLLLCPWLVKKGPDVLLPFINAVYDPEVGVGYVFIANLAASGLTILLLLPVMVRDKMEFSAPLLKKMLAFSLPLMVAGLAGVANESLGKIMLTKMLPAQEALSQVGIYGANFKISILITIFVQAFRYAADPFFFSNASNPKGPELYARVMKLFVVFCLFLFLGITLFMDFVQHFVGPAYRQGLGVVPVLLIANILLGIYFNLSIWYKLSGKTKFGAYISIFGVSITTTLNFVLIPAIGYYGAAWATLTGYLLMVIISYLLGQRKMSVPYDVKRISLYFAVALVAYFVSTFTANLDPLLRYLSAVLLLGLFAFFVYLCDPDLRESVKSLPFVKKVQ